ncbi:TonB-dependent receptor plug domain-containing protein [Sphingomonas sp. Leaf33]|uniref:TonB-dependent receptor plug domain-containing protein n=1 Tax=Sphingomonas sp. Leaf33 TaxID=1736215 RepID=UPI000A797A6C|nr:TonB-dependent receptor plug domain-containing protein [Sphingomonas sp. Leaf33]
MKTTLTHLLMTTVLATGLALPAAAQTTTAGQTGDPVADAKLADDDTRTDTLNRAGDVVVTGTRILRPNNTSAAPITTVTTAEIAAQGATTIEEVLNRLPQIQANAEQNYADSSGAQRIKLRSLGFERTLVLVDGTRLGLVNQQDTSLIPNALVERIDVLSGGASSVYGSDAVSGVVNFVLKKNFDGIRLDGNYSFYNHNNRAGPVTDAANRAFFPASTSMVNDGGRTNVTLAAGKNLFDNAVNISAFVNYRKSDLIPLRNRSYSACEVTQPTRDGPLACSVASFTPAGTIIPLSPLAGANQNRQLVNNPNGSRTFVPINSGPNTAANPYDGFAFQREFERVNYGGFLTAKVAQGLELYGTALVYRDESRNPQLARTLNFGAYGSTPYQVGCNNPYLSASQATTLCGAQAGTATIVPIDVRYRFDDNGPTDSRFINKGYRFTAGARGRVFGDVWNYDAVAVLSRNEITSQGQTFADFTKVSRAVDVVSVNGVPTCRSVVNGTDPACVPFNAFLPFNGSPALQSYLFGGGAFDLGNSASNNAARMFQGLVTIGGDLGKYGITSPLATQGIAIAFGGEYRDEKQTNSADAQYRSFYGGSNGVFTQNVIEGNVEVQAPLVEDKSWTKLLQLNAGYRVSKYNRLQGTFNTWKVEGIWSPIEDIGFRGAYNKAQRAPSVTQAASASLIEYNSIGSRNDPCASTPSPTNPNVLVAPTATIAQCRATGLPDNLYGSATLSCPDGACTIRNGGFGLTPETAYTKTFGVILRPRFVPGLTVSIDRILVDLKDSINYYAAADFLNGCLTIQTDFYCRGVVRNPGTFTLFSAANTNPTTGFFAQGLTNGFKSSFHSWDFQGQYGVGIGKLGRLDTSFNGSLATKVGNQDAPELADRNCVGYFGPFCGESLPRWSHTLRTTWTTADRVANVSVNWRHRSNTTITYNVTDPTGTGIPFTAADRRATYARTGAYDYIDLSVGFDIAKQYSLRLAVNNVFDTDPPLLPNARNVLGLLRNNTLMGYDLLGRQFVAGVTVNF